MIKGEFQLTSALENMKNKGAHFIPGEVEEWLDCGNKNATVFTNARILEHIKNEENLVAADLNIQHSTIIEPCYIAEGVTILNSVIGPNVSIGKSSLIENCIVKNSIIQKSSTIKNKLIDNSMVGNNTTVFGKFEDLSIGDYNQIS